MANTPEESYNTRIKERINPTFELSKAIEEQTKQNILLQFNQPLKPIATLEGSVKNTKEKSLPIPTDLPCPHLSSPWIRFIRDDNLAWLPIF